MQELNQTSRGEGGFGSTTAKKIEQAVTDGVAVDSSNAVVCEGVAEGVEVAEEGVTTMGEPKKADVDLENQPPTEPASGSRKRSSDIIIENENGQVKKARSDSSTSIEMSQP